MKSHRHHIILLLLALTPVLPVRAALPAASADAASTSPRASLLNHWRRLFPTTDIPALLLSRASPLTATQVATLSSYIDTHTLNAADHLSSFCTAAEILCADNLDHGVITEGGSDVEDIQPEFDNIGYKIRYASGRDLMTFIHNPALLEPGLFFREAAITTGGKIQIPGIRDKTPRTYFLPKELSDKLPFSSKSLPSLVELLRVGGLQSAMSSTMSLCELQPMSGERKSCLRSIEDMANFVAGPLGQKSVALFSQSADGSGQNATVVAAAAMNGGKETATVACHHLMFPYMVYYCHLLPNVKVYNVELLVGDGAAKKSSRQVAVCHMNTSDWSPNHAAFEILGSGPGQIEACHFLLDSAITWAVRE